MRDLQPSDYGRRFSAFVHENFIKGKVSYSPDSNVSGFYLCYNHTFGSGFLAKDKLGYNNSWWIGNGSVEDMKKEFITDFKFINMTAIEIEEYKDFKKEDILIHGGSKNRRKIVEQLGEVLFVKDFDEGSIRTVTKEKLYECNWRLDVTPEEEEKPVVELSVAEIAKKLGYSPEQLKVVDK